MNAALQIRTNGPGLTEITDEVAAFASEHGGSGVLTVFVLHTSCSLLIQENADPDVLRDLQSFFRLLVPPADDSSMHWLRHTTEGPDDMPAHIKASLLPVSLSIPVVEGRMQLGTWQGVYLFEHRDAPHTRRVALHLSE